MASPLFLVIPFTILVLRRLGGSIRRSRGRSSRRRNRSRGRSPLGLLSQQRFSESGPGRGSRMRDEGVRPKGLVPSAERIPLEWRVERGRNSRLAQPPTLHFAWPRARGYLFNVFAVCVLFLCYCCCLCVVCVLFVIVSVVV
jgi:hypothetical protein